jgi:hypothetical protein
MTTSVEPQRATEAVAPGTWDPNTAARSALKASAIAWVVPYAFLHAVPGETPGVADDMTGPTNVVINFASYLVPLGVLELYFRARRSPRVFARFAAAALVLAAAVATGIGVYGRIADWLG